MADLRSRFLEDYAGGMLNVARQELSTTGEVLVQDGFTSEGTLFVEDGSGVKSGLRLGVSLAEAVDPTTETGIVNVRFADRTYAKIRDLKVFSTAIASAQAALSDAAATSITNLETAIQLLEDSLDNTEQNFEQVLTNTQAQLSTISDQQITLAQQYESTRVEVAQLDSRVKLLEIPPEERNVISTLDLSVNNIYYTGTIAITGGVVTGTDTSFGTTFNEGDVFVAFTSSGEEVEFQVKTLDPVTPSTKMFVVPTNKTIASGSRFARARNLELGSKINEIVNVLRKLNFIV